jgi:hypothetical protein
MELIIIAAVVGIHSTKGFVLFVVSLLRLVTYPLKTMQWSLTEEKIKDYEQNVKL